MGMEEDEEKGREVEDDEWEGRVMRVTRPRRDTRIFGRKLPPCLKRQGKGAARQEPGNALARRMGGAQQQAYTEANDDDPSTDILHLSECLPKAQWHCAARVWHRLPGLPLRTGFWW